MTSGGSAKNEADFAGGRSRFTALSFEVFGRSFMSHFVQVIWFIGHLGGGLHFYNTAKARQTV